VAAVQVKVKRRRSKGAAQRWAALWCTDQIDSTVRVLWWKPQYYCDSTGLHPTSSLLQVAYY